MVKSGDKVKVNYTGTFDNGEVFDSSKGREPLEFTVDAGQVIQGFNDCVIGMEIGDKKTIRLEPTEAYGEYRDELVVEFPKDRFPEDVDVQVGMMFQLQQPDYGIVTVVVKEVKEVTVILDANHPMAGKVLNFEIELVEVA